MSPKALTVAKQIRRNLVAKHPVPLSITANITGRCNLKCIFCEKGSQKSGDEIALAGVKSLVDLGMRFDCPVFIGGGEPFLYSSIWELLSYAAARGKQLSLVTNGTCLESISDDQLRLLSNVVSMMVISIDSADPADHDRMRGVPGTFAKAMFHIKRPDRRHPITISSILTPDLAKVEPLIDLAADLGCALSFQPLGFETNYPDLDRTAWKDEQKRNLAPGSGFSQKLWGLHRKARRSGIVTNLGLLARYCDVYFACANTNEYFMDKFLNRFICFIPFQQIVVNERGEILPCSYLCGTNTIYDGDPYEQWLVSALRHRDAFIAGKRFPACRSCVCHFAENLRSSVLAHPFANSRQLLWFLRYYAVRYLRKDAVVQ